MCKVFMVPGITKQNRQDVTKFLKFATEEMTSSFDKDGFGYAAITKTGQVYGEKWLNVADAWKIYANPENTGNKFLMDNFGDGLKTKASVITDIYEKFGQKTPKAFEETCAVMLHSRNATTGDKNIANVHPFFEPENTEAAHGDTALIHNGNVVNHLTLKKKYSTCDSEVILHEYLRSLIQYSPDSMDTLSKALIGNYVVGVLTSAMYEANVITPFLDIFKSGGRNLHVSYIERFKSPVFATEPDIIKNACKKMNIAHSEILEIDGGTFFRIDAITGKIIDKVVKFAESPTTTPSTHTHHHRRNYEDQWLGHGAKEEADNVLPLNAGPTKLEQEKRDFRSEYFVPDRLTAEDERMLEELVKNGDRKPQVIQLLKKAMQNAGKAVGQ